MLKIRNLNKKIKNKNIIDKLSLELDSGIYGLLGPNGAGKTTLLRCITGVYSVPKKVISIDDKYISGTPEYLKQIGYLPQTFGLFKDMKVYDMMMYLAGFKIKKESEAKDEVLATLEKVKLADRKNDKVKTLSGGMVRRLGIAQALIGNPKIIIFDEPTASLDPGERVRFKRIISELEKDKIVIISTHIVSDVENLCNKVLVLDKGTILFNGSVDELENKGKQINSDSESALEKGYLCVLKDS